MLQRVLEELEKTNPREYAVLKELDSLDHCLNELLLSQNNSVTLNTSEEPARICLHIYNTYNETDEDDQDHIRLHTVPWSFTLHIRGYEVDSYGSMLPAQEPGVLSRYFKHILVCTNDRTVMWDRDGIKEYHDTVIKYANGWRAEHSTSMMVSGMTQDEYDLADFVINPPPSDSDDEQVKKPLNIEVPLTNAQDEDFIQFTEKGVPVPGREGSFADLQMPDTEKSETAIFDVLRADSGYMYSNHYGEETRNVGLNLGMDGRGGNCVPFNGYDELHVTQPCAGNREVTLYLFPSHYSAVCSISEALHQFLKCANKGSPIEESPGQVSLYRVTSSIVQYTYEKDLIYQKPDGTFFNIDKELSKLFDMPEGYSMSLQEIPICIRPHISPPKPIRITHTLVLEGDSSIGDRFVEVPMATRPNIDGKVIMTDHDDEIDAIMNELKELIHVRNLYSMYSREPLRFIQFMLNNYTAENLKPITQADMDRFRTTAETWLPLAIDTYMSWAERPVFQLLYGSLNNFIMNEVQEFKEERLSDHIPEFDTTYLLKDRTKWAQKNKQLAAQRASGGMRSKGQTDRLGMPDISTFFRRKIGAKEGTILPQLMPGLIPPVYKMQSGTANEDKDISSWPKDELQKPMTYTMDKTAYENLPYQPKTEGYPRIDMDDPQRVVADTVMQPENGDGSGYPAHRMDNKDSSKYEEAGRKDPIVTAEASIMAEGDKIYVPYSSFESSVDVMKLPEDFVQQEASITQKPASFDINENVYLGNMTLDHCFSRETHFDLREHLVEEGERTLEGNFGIFSKDFDVSMSLKKNLLFEKLDVTSGPSKHPEPMDSLVPQGPEKLEPLATSKETPVAEKNKEHTLSQRETGAQNIVSGSISAFQPSVQHRTTAVEAEAGKCDILLERPTIIELMQMVSENSDADGTNDDTNSDEAPVSISSSHSHSSDIDLSDTEDD